MASVIKSNSAASLASPVIFSFEDAVQHASRCIEEAQAQAAAIIAEAQRQAKQISLRSQQDGQNAGWRSAERAIDEKIAQKMESLLPALQKTIADLGDTRQACLRHWEQTAVHLAAKIAQRIIRRELSQKPLITLDLVREALQLAAGSPKLKIALHPDDFDALHGQVDRLINEIASAAEAEIVPDITVSLGGCRIETRQGLIDQQIETQLERVIAELTGGND